MSIFNSFFLILTIVTLNINFKSSVLKTNTSINLTSEIEKINIQYKIDPNDSIKIEPNYDPNYVKNEDSIIIYNNDFKIHLKEAIESSFYKTTVKSLNQVVGVFKSSTCEIYPTLEVYLDCEDNNPWSSITGWVGASTINSSKNITLRFCVIGGYQFETYNEDYAVLMLNPWDPTELGYNKIERYMDNEDNSNQNNTYLNGTLQSKPFIYGDCSFSNNTDLYFYYFPGNNSFYNSLPNLSFEYGVLGRFGKFQGNIFCDDEDNGNANSLCVTFYNNTTWSYDAPDCWNYRNGIPNIVDGGNNTRFYICKAPNECFFPNN